VLRSSFDHDPATRSEIEWSDGSARLPRPERAGADAQDQVRIRQKAEKRRARLHRTLEREHAVLTATLGAMSDGLLLIDAHHRIRYHNAIARNMLRIESDPIVGDHAGMLLDAIGPYIHDPESRARWRASISDAPGGFDVAVALPGHPVVILRVDAFHVQPPRGKPITALLLRDVTSTSLLARARERERIAMDLHDGAVQSLYGVVMGLGAIELDLADRPEAERSLAVARQARTQISDIISGIRTYASRLRLGISGTRDLRSGIEAIAAEVAMNRLVPPELDFDASDLAQLSPHAVENLLLVAHEATSNVIRHSGATTVAIRWKRVKGACVLTIEDNGRGFVVGATGRRSGDGLRNMRERALALGGRLSVKSEPGSGTEVRLLVPLEVLCGVAA